MSGEFHNALQVAQAIRSYEGREQELVGFVEANYGPLWLLADYVVQQQAPDIEEALELRAQFRKLNAASSRGPWCSTGHGDIWSSAMLVARVHADGKRSTVTPEDPEPQWHKDVDFLLFAKNVVPRLIGNEEVTALQVVAHHCCGQYREGPRKACQACQATNVWGADLTVAELVAAANIISSELRALAATMSLLGMDDDAEDAELEEAEAEEEEAEQRHLEATLTDMARRISNQRRELAKLNELRYSQLTTIGHQAKEIAQLKLELASRARSDHET